MKKVLVTIIAVFLFCSTAFAKDLTVKFNFPLQSTSADFSQTINVEEDANAFSAFLQAAQSNSIELDISYFDFDGDGAKEAAFINKVNEVGTTDDFSKYWLFSANNKSSLVGISQFVPQNNDTISLDYFEGQTIDAIEWLADNQQESGQIGANFFQHTFALMALSLSSQNNANVPTAAANNAINFAISTQGSQAEFFDELQTATATMALLSNGKSLQEFSKNSKTSTIFLESAQNPDGGFESGSDSSDVDTTSWAITAFSQAGKNLPQKNGKTPIDYLIFAQHPDGSFGYNQTDATQSIEFTEEALIAFSAASYPKDAVVQKSIDWISTKQNENGCITDGFRTALGSIALRSYNETQKSENALECLKALQNGDGSFGRSSNPSNAIDTGLAVIALSKKTFPLTIQTTPTTDQNAGLGLNSIIKFVVTIKNTGEVDAENVSVTLNGVPAAWLEPFSNSSIDHFEKIESDQTKIAEIFVQAKTLGKFDVVAQVAASTLSSPANSNAIELNIAETALQVNLSYSKE